MTLAEVKDATAFDVLKTYLDTQNPGANVTYWIGLKYSVANVFTWTTGSVAMTWANWDTGYGTSNRWFNDNI